MEIVRHDVLVDVKGKLYRRRWCEGIHVWYYAEAMEPVEPRLAQTLELLYEFNRTHTTHGEYNI